MLFFTFLPWLAPCLVFPLRFGEGDAERLQQFLQFDFWAASLECHPKSSTFMDTVTQPTWKLKLQHLCPANKDLEQLFKKKKKTKVHMQIKENAISMFPYGTSSLSSLPGFRELCWASSVCSKHLLAFYSNPPPFRRCTGSDLEGYDRMRKDLRWVSGIRLLPGTGSVLSLLQDAFCCVWFLRRFLVLEQFTAATTLCWTLAWFLRGVPCSSCCRIMFCAAPCAYTSWFCW